MANTLKVAVLDDYQELSKPHFKALGPEYEVAFLKDTLPPYNHPATSPGDKEQLVQRLAPFNIICTFNPNMFPITFIIDLFCYNRPAD